MCKQKYTKYKNMLRKHNLFEKKWIKKQSYDIMVAQDQQLSGSCIKGSFAPMTGKKLYLQKRKIENRKVPCKCMYITVKRKRKKNRKVSSKHMYNLKKEKKKTENRKVSFKYMYMYITVKRKTENRQVSSKYLYSTIKSAIILRWTWS